MRLYELEDRDQRRLRDQKRQEEDAKKISASSKPTTEPLSDPTGETTKALSGSI